ncbi:PREDICTED: unconventional myosin-XV [Lepidothrix coronata]|uniref:Unconventional myosin-XV n=1 Tax=Lepidothrix coronata TaxID=321398 RepID=A0A6J0HVN2_9PASS|nr:PREDICTED: unconventional myosin-XV [Lepidothrix coronata]
MAGKKGVPKKEAKGKAGKKGKKEDPSESEDASDAELLKEEKTEETEVVEEEKHEEEEAAEDPKKGKGKEKEKGKEKKALPKAGVAKKIGRGKKVQLESQEEEDESDATTSKKNLKGTSKMVMGLAADKKKKGAKGAGAKGAEAKGQPKESAEPGLAKEEEAAAPKTRAKRSLRSTSKLFMGFKKLGLHRPKKGQFKNTSRFFWGLHKQSTKKRKKKKNKAVLKSTSNLMMRFKHVGKKRKEEEAKKKKEEEAKKEAPSKPSFLLLRRGGQATEDGALLFRRCPERKFKPRARVLSKAAAATGWLARKVLSRRGRLTGLTGGSRATDTAWLSRIGARKLPFPAEDEILRHRANMKRIPGSSGLLAPGTVRQGSMVRRPSRRRSQHAPAEPPVPRYGWAEEEDRAFSRRRGYGKEEDAAYGSRRGYAKKKDGAYGSWRGHPKEEGGAYGPQHGYAEEDGAYGPWHGYTDEEDGAFSPQHGYSEEEEGYMQSPAYPAGYRFEDAVPTPYGDYPGYETEEEEEYDVYGGFWEEGDPPGHPYGYTELEDEGPFGGGSPLGLYDPYGSDPEYGEEAEGPFGYRGDPYEDFEEPFAGGYPGGEYPEHRIQYSEGGWAPHAQSSCNPYALGLEEIAEGEEPEEWEEEEEEEKDYPFSILSASSLRGMRETLSSKLSLNRKFRLFPRPQVKLFGRDRLDVPLPPSPHLPAARDEDDYDEYEPPRPPAAPGPAASPARRVSAARACGSPLGQFLQRSLSQPQSHPPRGAGGLRGPRTPQPSYRRSSRRLAGMESAGLGGRDPPPRASPARDPSPPAGPWVQPPPREPGTARRPSLRNPFANLGRSPSPPPARPRPGSTRGEGSLRSLRASLRRFNPEPPAPPPAAPRSPGPAGGRRLGGPAAGSGRPLSTRRSSPPGLPLPQAWPRLPEPPTKAVKPLQRTPFLAPSSRPGSRRLGRPGPSWDEELPPWQGAPRGLAGVPPPPSPAPSTPKSFIQRIGQPLAGMAPHSPPARPSAEAGGHSPSSGRSVGQSLASLLVRSMASTKAPPSSPPSRHPSTRSPSLPRRPSRRDGSIRRSPSPPSGRRGWADAARPVPPSNPRGNRSPSPQRRAAFPPPHGRAPGSPVAPRHGARPPGPAEPVEGEGAAGEEGAGRYAVVTPQVQRLGSFRRASRMYKQHWSTQHVVRVREMPDAWTAEQGPPQQPTQRGRRWASQRGADIARYLSQRSPGGGWRDRHPWADGYLGTKQPWRTKMQSLCSLPIVRYQEPQEEDGLEDMTQLEDLQEAAVLNNIRTRFERQLIYTYIGSILVSVNPYRLYNIYGTEQVLQYEGRALGENPPHLFAIANVAYSKVMDAKHNQCIIISGESGSGKTEATKLILRYLAAVSQKRSTAPQIEILEATPLLESFGNAKTVRNDNSSRFGKFVEIFLEDGLICGAITSQYLLEKSRVVFQAKSERNYHIFYEMLAGLPAQQRQRYCLQGAETYYYLNQGGNCEIPGKDDAEDFRRLLNTMEVLSFSVDEQNSIFRILSSVLHLGNVYFEKYETDCQEVATVVSATEIRTVAELLQVSPEGLQKAITFKVTETLREKIFTPLTVESAVDARDAIAKTLYSLLFGWLTDRINKLVYPRQEALSIAILDIYGFEDLNFNSFEQLCINYANEYLQFFFNKIVFQEEQEEYLREQIEWKEIPFSDNQPCIDLISQKPYGILRILDDQSCFPQATDHTFLQKCHYHHGTNPLYTKPKMPLPEFTIKHYAGKVTYQVHKFLDKNYDQVRQDVLDLFISSKTKVVANLFFGRAQVMARQRSLIRRSSTRTRRYKAPTVAARFQQSLLELVEKMERCNPFFVRCLKPNNKKEPGLFEADVVSSQLRYSGILETIRIRKEGFPIRIPFLVFIDRYRCLVDMWSNIIPNGANCVEMLRNLCTVNPGMYYVGVTKLFLKEQLYQALESKRARAHHLAALTLQRYARTFFIKRRFRSLRRKIVLLQSRARGYLARQRYRRMRHTLIKFRSLVHIYVNRRRYLKRKEDARRRAEEEKERMKEELTRREVVDVTHLEIPAELMGLLEAAAAAQEVNAGCVVLVPPPALQPDSKLTLPLDINDYPMAKYVRGHFQEPAFGMLTAPLKAPLTRLDEELCHEALSIFQLILRFMGDPGLGGLQETLFGNYIVQKGLSVPGLRDELLAQAANQVWRNTNVNNEERGWLLLATCLSAFPPSAAFDKYLLKFVSDYAFAGYKPVCQRKLMHAMARSQLGTAAARTFPPSLLEWTANRQQASMALDLHCFNGDQFSCPIHSWSTGEDLAGDVLKHRGLAEGWRGWSVAMKVGSQWAELAGHDYVLDLISDLELLRGFPRQKSCFLIAWDGTESLGRDSRVVLGHGLDLDEVPPPPAVKAPTLPSTEMYHPHDGEFGEPRSQKGLDRYLDSLFDPVLSYGNGELEKPTILSQRMKGGGGVGGGDSGSDANRSGPPVPAEMRQPRGTEPALSLQSRPDANQPPGLSGRAAEGTPPCTPQPRPYSQKAAAVGRRWPGELVRHSRLNSEHFPRPTHDIRNIIRQCQPALRSSQAPSKLFGKKVDPHEEAMQILKEQLSAARVPAAVGPKEVVATVKPVPSARYQLRAPTGRPAATRPPVSVSRELPSEAQQVQTQLHRSCSEDFYTYHNVPWKIFIRKEVFYPKDSINNPLLLDLIFRQIFNDVLSDTCIRISQEERLRLKSLFAENKLDSFSPVATESVKREIIAAARDGCEVYFSRLFPATGSVGTGVQILAVSHTGIKLLRLVKGTNVPGEQLRVLRAYSYADVLFVTTPSRNMLEFNLRSEKLILFSPKAPQVKVMVDHFITELRKDSQYVVAVRNYSPEDGGQLSFHKGDIIHLQSLEHPERDYYYGCVVRKKVMYLEELKTGTQDFGWKFGAIHGRPGLFPAEYVQPVAAPDFVHLAAERKEEPRDKQGRVAASAAVAVAVASTAAAQELDRKTEVSPASATFAESLEGDGVEQLRDVTGTCPMLAFAQRHFRAARHGTMDSCGTKARRDVPSVLEMLTFTKIPIQESLIEFVDGGINKQAAEAFQAVMKFMGDHPLRGQTELDAVCTILKLCAEHEVLRDEVYCQIIKQITNNTSSKTDSCQKGWRLLYILAAYYKCSEVLRPFLLAFLQDASRHPELPFHGIAKACEQNLRKTLQFGGRSLFPSSMELKAMVAGRSAKRQLFLLPGGIERHLKIKTCSVALDVIEELCCEMGLQHPEALEEYILFVVTDRGQSVRPLTRREYVLDVAAETECRDTSYTFWCRRVVWSQPLKFDNELYVTVHYNQVLPDYLKGLFTVLPPARPGEQHFPHVAKLAALQHRAKDHHHLPTAREMQDYVPPQLFRLLKPQSWLQMVTQHVQQAKALSAHQARAQFLGLLSAYPMFGSSFFYIQSCSNNAIVSPCILAVNQNGLNFLSKETHEPIAKFSLNEIQSTRTQRPTAGSSYPYVEITLGDLLAQGITQLQLEQGLELCRVVAVHMERLLGAREKRLTLPPSEITLL